MKDFNKKFGFTLSEVLITLGIIGIVAVLTIPAVMKNYRNRLYVAQLQKTYAQISDAVQAIMVDEHTGNFYETKASLENNCTNADSGDCTAGAGYFLNKYFKVVKRNCASGTNACAAASYKSIGGANAGVLAGDYCIQTTNGAAICMKRNTENNKVFIDLNIDVNGQAGPNITGRDVFYLTVQENGTVTDYRNTDEGNCSNPNSSGCFNKVRNAGWKMEY